MPPDPLQLRRRLALQGGGFALLLLAAFSASLYWGIASQRQEDQRTELRQLAGSAAAQLPLIAHETREAEGCASSAPGPGSLTLQPCSSSGCNGSMPRGPCSASRAV